MSEAAEQPRLTLYHRFDNKEGQFSTVRVNPKFHVFRHRW